MSLSLNLITLRPSKKQFPPPEISSSPGNQSLKGMNTKLFFLCLFVYQLLFIFQGIDLSDEGFLATFYQEIFKNPESVQYNFMFWLTGIIGGVYLKLFSFLGLWGLRLGGVLATTGTAMLTYKLLKNNLNRNYLKLGLFLVLINLNNDIKVLNYNNISALVYIAVIYFLFHGLKQKSNTKLFISGIFVSMNVFIRLPNILALGLVLAILYYSIAKKVTVKEITAQITCFISGFLICTAAILLAIYSVGHWDIFINALSVVYKMGTGSQQVEAQRSNYGILNLLHQLKSNNARSVFIALSIFVGLAIGISIFSSLKKKILHLNRISKPLKYLFILFVLLLIFKGVIDDYSILFFYTGVIVLTFLLVLLTPNSLEIRFLMFCGCFILVSYPFGSSAGILTAGRYAFWIGLPISINYLFNIKSIQNQFSLYQGEFNNSLQIIISGHQMVTAKNLLLVLLIFAGIFYSYFYPFFDRQNRIEMRYPVNNKHLKGIYTTKGRADVLNDLLSESSRYVKKGDYVLAYDCIPMYHFITETVPYIRSPYPWLYETEIFKNELDLAKQQKKTLPVVITQTIKTIGNGSKWPEETLPEDYSKWEVNQGRNKYMNEFLIDNNYKEVWADQYFKIYIPG